MVTPLYDPLPVVACPLYTFSSNVAACSTLVMILGVRHWVIGKERCAMLRSGIESREGIGSDTIPLTQFLLVVKES